MSPQPRYARQFTAIKPAPMSPKRAKVLAFIQAELAGGRPFPSRQAIAAHMGWKHITGVIDVLQTLAGRGDLERQWDRGWRFSLPASNKRGHHELG